MVLSRGFDARWFALKALAHAAALMPLMQLVRGALIDVRGLDPLAAVASVLPTAGLGADPVAAILGVLHFLWLVKSDLREPLIYAAVAAALLGARLWWRWHPPPSRVQRGA